MTANDIKVLRRTLQYAVKSNPSPTHADAVDIFDRLVRRDEMHRDLENGNAGTRAFQMLTATQIDQIEQALDQQVDENWGTQAEQTFNYFQLFRLERRVLLIRLALRDD